METSELQKPNEETTRISTETANMLGLGLKQMFAEPIQKLEAALESADLQEKVEPKYQTWVQEWKQKLDFVKEMFNSLATVRGGVFMTTVPGGGNFEFKNQNAISRFFSSLRTNNVDVIILPLDLTEKIRKVLYDRINNSFTPITGYSELISGQTSDVSIKKQTKLISELGWQVTNTLTKKFNNAQKLKLSKDSQGNVEITPLSLSSSPFQKT